MEDRPCNECRLRFHPHKNVRQNITHLNKLIVINIETIMGLPLGVETTLKIKSKAPDC